MSNSIRNNLDKETAISEIRLLLYSDYERKKSFIVVEGEDDCRFFKGKLNEDVDIVESFSGKHGVLEIISEINDNRVIGIRDKDCDPVTEHQRMFYYDYSCLEVMMIMNDMTWQSLCYQFYDGELSIDELRSKIFYDLKWLTLFRKLNSEREWGIRFDGFSYSNAWNENECFFDNELGFIELKNINADKQEERLFQCKTDVDGHLAYFDNDDLPFFTQGHDFINYFKCICDGRKGIIIKTIGQVLRGAYRLDDFEKSQLYERLTNYSANTGVRLLRMNQSRTFV